MIFGVKGPAEKHFQVTPDKSQLSFFSIQIWVIDVRKEEDKRQQRHG